MRIYLSPYLFVSGNEQIRLGDVSYELQMAADQAIWVETKFLLLEEEGQTDDAGRVVMLPDGNTVEMLMQALGL